MFGKRKPLTKDFFDQFFVLNNVFLVLSVILFIIYFILSLFILNPQFVPLCVMEVGF
jgi:hypothetical protein